MAVKALSKEERLAEHRAVEKIVKWHEAEAEICFRIARCEAEDAEILGRDDGTSDDFDAMGRAHEESARKLRQLTQKKDT